MPVQEPQWRYSIISQGWLLTALNIPALIKCTEIHLSVQTITASTAKYLI
jgi:hypothetical protein